MKNLFKSGVIYLLFGLFFLVMCFVYPDISVFFGLAGACIGPGLFMICKYSYWKKRPNEYTEKKENEAIEFSDERKEMIRGKSARISIMANWILQSIVIVILTFLGQLEVLPYDYVKPIIIGAALYWILSAIIMQIVYKYLSNKY